MSLRIGRRQMQLPVINFLWSRKYMVVPLLEGQCMPFFCFYVACVPTSSHTKQQNTLKWSSWRTHTMFLWSDATVSRATPWSLQELNKWSSFLISQVLSTPTGACAVGSPLVELLNSGNVGANCQYSKSWFLASSIRRSGFSDDKKEQTIIVKNFLLLAWPVVETVPAALNCGTQYARYTGPMHSLHVWHSGIFGVALHCRFCFCLHTAYFMLHFDQISTCC